MRKFNCVTVKCLSTKQTRTTPCPIHICIFEGESVMCCHGVDRLFREKRRRITRWRGSGLEDASDTPLFEMPIDRERWKCFVGCFPPVFCRLKQFIFHFGSIPKEKKRTHAGFFYKTYDNWNSLSSFQHNTPAAPLARKWNIPLFSF